MNFTCPDCNESTPMTPMNIVLVLHQMQPLYNFIEITCKCGSHWRVFGLHEYIGLVQKQHYKCERKQYADEVTIRAFAHIYFTSKLSPQQEDLLAYFHRILMDVEEVSDIDWKEHI